MAKMRKHSRSVKSLKLLKNTSKHAARGLKKVGSMTKKVISSSGPIVEKGVSTVYGTLATGFDLGVKGVKGVSRNMSQMTTKRRKHRRKSRRH
jgi:hypothetical protein